MHQWKHVPKDRDWSEHWAITVEDPNAPQYPHPRHQYGVLIVYEPESETYALWYRSRSTFYNPSNSSWTTHRFYKTLKGAQKRGLLIALTLRLEGEL